MPTIKITTLINQTSIDGRTGGFSESWYFEGTPAQAQASFDVMANLRANLLTQGATIVGGRIQVIGQAALAVVRNIPGFFNQQDIPQLAANCRVLTTGGLNKKYFQLRGVPDPSVVGGSIFPLGAWGVNFNTWANSLAAVAWKFKCRRLTNPQADVISIDANGVCVFAPGITFNQNGYLQILRGRDVNGRSVAGTYYVQTKVSDQACTLARWNHAALATRAKVRAVDFDYLPVQPGSATVVNVTTRKVGRPSNGYRGRARRR